MFNRPKMPVTKIFKTSVSGMKNPSVRRLHYTNEQIDGLKRVFEAHGMIVTGPPLDGDSKIRQQKFHANDECTERKTILY